jgi:hypothetical protein
VAEREAARLRRRPDELGGQQPVQRRQALGRRELGDGRREVGLEGLAHDRGGLHEQASRRRERLELLGDGGADGGWDLAIGGTRARRGCAARARELGEVERVAAAVVVQGVHAVGADELGGLLRRERGEREPGDPGRRERRDEAVGRLPRSERQRHEHGSGERAAQKRRDELEGRRLRPVQVVEHEDERLVVGQHRQQRAHGAVRPEALVGDGGRRAGAERREDRAQVVERDRVPAGRGGELSRGDVRVERVDPDAEREVALELRSRPAEDDVAAPVGPRPQLGQQARLADPRLALDRDPRTLARVDDVEEPVELGELALASNQCRVAERRAHRVGQPYVDPHRFRDDP